MYFVVGSMVVPEALWHDVAADLDDLKRHYRVAGELKWNYFSPHNSSAGNPLRHLDQGQRDDLRTKAYGIITSRKPIKLMCSVTSLAAAYALPSVNDADDVYFLTYKPLTERFQYMLQDQSRAVGRREYGIIVLDHRNRHEDARMRELHEALVTKDGPWTSDYRNLIEGLFMAPSHHSTGIQLADLVAGAVYRYFEYGDDRWFKLIRDSIRKSPTGNVDGYGLIKVPKGTWR